DPLQDGVFGGGGSAAKGTTGAFGGFGDLGWGIHAPEIATLGKRKTPAERAFSSSDCSLAEHGSGRLATLVQLKFLELGDPLAGEVAELLLHNDLATANVFHLAKSFAHECPDPQGVSLASGVLDEGHGGRGADDDGGELQLVEVDLLEFRELRRLDAL